MAKLSSPDHRHEAGESVARFMAAVHKYDGGRALPLLHAARITTVQLAALELAAHPSTVSEVATHLGLSRPATSQLLEKLVRSGLLLRRNGTTDRRERRVALSARGRSLVLRISAARAARFDAALASLPPDLSVRLSATLREVVNALATNAGGDE